MIVVYFILYLLIGRIVVGILDHYNIISLYDLPEGIEVVFTITFPFIIIWCSIDFIAKLILSFFKIKITKE